MLWEKDAFLRLHMEDELWIDNQGFPYAEDMLETYKLHLNGGKLGVLYDSGVENLDAASSSKAFRDGAGFIYTRTKVAMMVWWRACWRNGRNSASGRFCAAFSFCIKSLWLGLMMCVLAVARLNPKIIVYYIRGIRDARREARGSAFSALRPYVLTGQE